MQFEHDNSNLNKSEIVILLLINCNYSVQMWYEVIVYYLNEIVSLYVMLLLFAARPSYLGAN